ncbi:MAG TPA: MupA/Atu3671 family FMN-dependent luciferase-like monooxygenase [Thermoanaerobaculia bacterium]|jgi:natural product biosynthesis luciferase-like monooxygenase protein|nr:MupA/Atu3671 family FMN-dependent luciferase-like monooxygenase [Thermoanaerobaculia bacterium]
MTDQDLDLDESTATHFADVAIIGMAFRFPGASDPEALWRNLRDGVESILFFSPDELIVAGTSPELARRPDYVGAAGMVHAAVDRFDAGFFDLSPREAEVMDPQHRLLLECAWEALESAGEDPERLRGPAGVFAGAATGSYFLTLLARPDLTDSLGRMALEVGNDKDHLASQIAYRLNLHGPAVTVQTGCSTSLVAVHMAVQSLLNLECDVALAGGVSLMLPQVQGYLYQEGGVLSPDGHCRAFDERARGTVNGSGAAVVALKRLADALADGDTIHAVIKGSAVNNDGARKLGYTAPSVAGQAEVIAQALGVARLAAVDITYVEAHGTGTALGDPIEVAGLARAFAPSAGPPGSCAVGSVKTNLGHLTTAAGLAGLIKTVLMLRHRQIPPSLHFERLNPAIDLAGTPFFINAELRPWEPEGGVRRAGVSSFSIGGTNAHVIVAEAPAAVPQAEPEPEAHLIVVSAKTEAALAESAARLAGVMDPHPPGPPLPPHTHPPGEGGKSGAGVSLGGGAPLPGGGSAVGEGSGVRGLSDIAHTLQLGRKAFRHRRFAVCRDAAEAVALLTAPASGAEAEGHRPVAFLFPGQGAQRPGMGGAVYRREPVFRREVDRCAEILTPHLGRDLRAVLLAAPDDAEAARDLAETALAQPALFVVSWALARLWMSWGVRPDALLGHSVGEYAAACLSGVFALEDALALVALRGRLLQALPPGAMLAVALPEEDLAPRLTGDLGLAAVNGPAACVAAGPPAAIAALGEELAAAGVACRPLPVNRAFHAPCVEPAVEPLVRQVAAVRCGEPRIPWISNVTGAWIGAAEAVDPEYWGRHLRRPVRFADGLAALLSEPARAFLELGPGDALTRLTQRHPAAGTGRVAVPSLAPTKGEGEDDRALLTALGTLWQAGAAIDWAAVRRDRPGRRVPLPTYPFERQRYWIDVEPTAPDPQVQAPPSGLAPPPAATGPAGAEPTTDVEREIADLLRELLGVASIGIHDNILALGVHSLLAVQLVNRLRGRYQIEIPLATVFEAPTVATLAWRVVMAQLGTSAEDPELEAMLREIEGLSDSELRSALAEEPAAEPEPVLQPVPRTPEPTFRGLAFSLMFFSSDGRREGADKYRLLIDAARFADEHGFEAVWTPERHFQDFGGLYPNPSVLSAALAMVTSRVEIRAGSLVLPLHNPVRVAEDWLLLENLSNGRVGLSLATGWHPSDFALAPANYPNRRRLLVDGIAALRRIWREGKITLPGVDGGTVEVAVLPRPLRAELPLWLTTSGSAETWERAGQLGVNILAGHSGDELASRIELYRRARAAHGHDPAAGRVTLMLHSFLGADLDTVKRTVREPMIDYLGTFISQGTEGINPGVAGAAGPLSDRDRRDLAAFAFESYFGERSLLGTPESVAPLLDRLERAGVDEVACLVDFGLPPEAVLAGLPWLDSVRRARAARARVEETA